MEKSYRAAKYIRTSCPDDKEQYRDSVANQSKVIDGFLRTHPEISIVVERIDEGYSGLFYNRPAFHELVADIKAGQVNCVIVKDLSRLGRSYIDTGIYFRDLFQSHNVRFISVNDNIDSIGLDGIEKILFQIKNIFNEQYCYDVSVKTRRALQVKREQGQYIGAVPIYGYKRSEDNRHRLMTDPNTYKVVQSIYQMKLAGFSAAKIAVELNKATVPSPLAYKRAQGIACPTGGYSDKPNARWSATTVLRILQDENYTGTLVQGRRQHSSYKSKSLLSLPEKEWSKTENAHPAIVSKPDFDAVQRVLAMDTRTSPNCNRVHVFSGLLICGRCGANMTRKTARDRGRCYVYYGCPKCYRDEADSSPSVSENDLFRRVTNEIKDRIANIEKLLLDFSQREISSMAHYNHAERISLYSQAIQDLQTYRIHLHSSLADNLINALEFRSLQKYYDNEIACLEEEISALQKRMCSAGSFKSELNWTDIFMQFRNVGRLDRTAVVKMVRSIIITNKHKIAVVFVCQQEYDQLIHFFESRGCTVGEKKPQTE